MPTPASARWTEQQFIDKFKAFENTDAGHARRAANAAQNTVMPITAYAGMTREDLAAIYAYLRTLKPVVESRQQVPRRANHEVKSEP